MTELAAIALGWATVVGVTVAAWRRFCRKQPRPAPPPFRAIDDGSMRVTLTERQRVSIELAALAVSTHMEKAVALGCDYTNSAGVGRLVVLVCDDEVFTRAVEPAVKAHLAARTT